LEAQKHFGQGFWLTVIPAFHPLDQFFFAGKVQRLEDGMHWDLLSDPGERRVQKQGVLSCPAKLRNLYQALPLYQQQGSPFEGRISQVKHLCSPQQQSLRIASHQKGTFIHLLHSFVLQWPRHQIIHNHDQDRAPSKTCSTSALRSQIKALSPIDSLPV